MRKKIFLLICLVLFTTGCSATYDLYVGEKLTDNIFLYDNNDILKGLDYYDMEDGTDLNFDNYSYNVSLFERDYNYDKKEYSTNDIAGYNYNYTYNYNKFKEKSMIFNCYDEIVIDKGNNFIVQTSNEFKCFEQYNLLDDVTVNIHHGGNLISTNADKYSEGIYTWYINKSNYQDKEIYLEVENYQKNYTLDIVGGIIFGILLLVSAIFVYIYKKKFHR